MAEQRQKQGEGFKKQAGGGDGGGGDMGGQDTREKAKKAIEKANEQVFTNHVVYGANDVELQLEGHTVAQIEEALAEVLNLDAGAEAYVDGAKVDDKSRFQLKAGQRLEFMKESGQKGFFRKRKGGCVGGGCSSPTAVLARGAAAAVLERSAATLREKHPNRLLALKPSLKTARKSK